MYSAQANAVNLAVDNATLLLLRFFLLVTDFCASATHPVATYGCESWTLRKNEETRVDAFEMKGLGKILRV